MQPKILLFDIETFPLVMEAWNSYEANFLRILRPTTIACFAAMWLEDKHCLVKGLPDYKGYKPVKPGRIGPVDDKKICKDIWDLLNEADIVIAHNGKKFDVKKVNARFEVHGFPPPSPYRILDTLLEGRKVFGYDSQKLNERGRMANLGTKEDSGGINTWIGCLEGNAKKWRQMKKYNKRDVTLLKEVYLLDRAWMPAHPNLAAYLNEEKTCPKCQGHSLQKRGFSINNTTKFQNYSCNDCKGWSRMVVKVEKKNIVKI